MKVPTVITILSSQEDIMEFQKLIFDKYCLDRHWFDPKEFPKGVFFDQYDKSSVFITVRKNNLLVGGVRLVLDSPMKFPHEKLIGITLPYIRRGVDERIRKKLAKIKRKEIAEVTRVTNKSVKTMITRDLAKIFYWYGVSKNIKAYYMVIDMVFFLLCHKISAPVYPIDVARFVEGSWTIPAILFTDEIKTVLSKKNPSLWEHVLDTSNLVGDWGDIIM